MFESKQKKPQTKKVCKKKKASDAYSMIPAGEKKKIFKEMITKSIKDQEKLVSKYESKFGKLPNFI